MEQDPPSMDKPVSNPSLQGNNLQAPSSDPPAPYLVTNPEDPCAGSDASLDRAEENSQDAQSVKAATLPHVAGKPYPKQYDIWSQMLVRVHCDFGDGKPVWLDALVDTGAYSNIVSTRVTRNRPTRVADRPKRFVTANGQDLDGGTHVAKMTLVMKIGKNDTFTGETHAYTAWAHVADITNDLILSYQFLVRNKLIVVPHKGHLLVQGTHGYDIIPGCGTPGCLAAQVNTDNRPPLDPTGSTSLLTPTSTRGTPSSSADKLLRLTPSRQRTLSSAARSG